MKLSDKKTADFDTADLSAIVQVIERLLAPDGCPWDKEQTPLTLCDYLTEECFELVDALRSGDKSDIEEEMGDVFFLLLFLTKLLQKDGVSDLAKIAQKNVAKMIGRHPHVFSDMEIHSRQELIANWERIKKSEHGEKKGVFASLPVSLPPLLRAYRIHSKAERAGFGWQSDTEFNKHLQKEMYEWEQALKSGDKDSMQEEFGDLLFTLVELGRRNGIKANFALVGANLKFIRRFAAMEKLAEARGGEFDELAVEQKNVLWNEVKEQESEDNLKK